MPYQVQQILEDKSLPVWVTKTDPVTKALALMIEHDYSQLPVVDNAQGTNYPIGKMITYEGILRGMRNFKVAIDSLRVMDVMTNAPIFSTEDDLFDIMDRLKAAAAVLITDVGQELVGIVTMYDTTEYFRNRTENLMRVEDIELTVKDFIRVAYTADGGEVDEVRLDQAAIRVASYGRNPAEGEKKKTFADLTLGDYIQLLSAKDTWDFFQPIFNLPREAIRELLNNIREIRNTLAHFRGDITPEQRDKLQFCADWLATCQMEYQEKKKTELIASFFQPEQVDRESTLAVRETSEPYTVNSKTLASDEKPNIGALEFAVTEADSGGSRYAPLADWLQSQPGKKDLVTLTFNEIEQIIGRDLPASARNHRAWWANDSVSHPQSQLWLDAGWRTTYISMGEGRVSFARIREREKAYIAFFSALLTELRTRANFPVRNASPDGTSWIVVAWVTVQSQAYANFVFSFSRDKRLRVELYLDTYDQETTKQVFDRLYARKEELEEKLEPLSWERLDNRRASRIAAYRQGQVDDDETKLIVLRRWAAETMVKFHEVLEQPAKTVITEVLGL